ncbi:hypothetical protein VNO77_20341 [Canavalia gladiata]|uniref:Uncharacterized protein n=1 Tax=Canavalia gladiata TaxID=3824 RepID=A0AAN9LPE5_CANGL
MPTFSRSLSLSLSLSNSSAAFSWNWCSGGSLRSSFSLLFYFYVESHNTTRVLVLKDFLFLKEESERFGGLVRRRGVFVEAFKD